MRGRCWMAAARALTPTGWIAAIGGIALVLFLVAGLRWDPFDLAARRARAAEARADTATASAEARALEAEGERAMGPRIRAADAVAARADAATQILIHQARSADDAPTSLSPDRADRLLAHDRELCRIAAHLDGCAAAAATAAGG